MKKFKDLTSREQESLKDLCSAACILYIYKAFHPWIGKLYFP